MPVEDFIIFVFCYVDDQLKKLNLKLRSRGFSPAFSDSEVITIEVVGAFIGQERDKDLWQFFSTGWRHFFPLLPSRTTFVRQAANLWKVKQLLQQMLTEEVGPDNVHIIDGFPLEVRHIKRAYRGACFKGEASFGRSFSRRQLYFGFKGHILVTMTGVIKNFILAPAHIEEHQVLEELTNKITGLLLGDKGYVGEKYRQRLLSRGIFLQTPLKKNMKDERPACFVKKIKRARKIVETVIDQLIYRFKARCIWARDQWHLVNRLSRQLLAHTLGVLLNRQLGRKSIVFEGLVL